MLQIRIKAEDPMGRSNPKVEYKQWHELFGPNPFLPNNFRISFNPSLSQMPAEDIFNGLRPKQKDCPEIRRSLPLSK